MHDDTKDHRSIHVPPPFIFLLFWLAGFLLHLLLPISFPVPAGMKFMGILLMTGAAVLIYTSLRTFTKAETSFIPGTSARMLLTTGIFRYSRNPIYLGYAAAYTGLSLMTGLIWPLILLPVVIVIMNETVIAGEETYLQQRFGRQYRTYKSRVRRWL